MMNIREYFQIILDTEGLEASEDAQYELWDLCEDEDFDLEGWAASHGIDLSATTEVLGDQITYWTLWCWDMDGD